ncbi:MAG: anti-sigma F factor [Firmicutes bacterium]|nr:anti-sigma F factor [Bacillota bacterium]
MKRTVTNEMKLRFSAISENESFARVVISGFVMRLGVTPGTLADIKTAVSEAVTNSIVHAYKGHKDGKVELSAKSYDDGTVIITVADKGCGIPDIELAREPFYTTDRESERSGMGFAIMESFMNRVRVSSVPDKGTRVVMTKKLGG